MTTKEAEGILELAGRYFRNQWAPGASSEESRETILEAARVLLDGESGKRGEGMTREEQSERVASELALIDGYNPNDHPPNVWAAIATGYRKQADRIVNALGLDDNGEMVSADWHGLTTILDTLYPVDVFTGESGDPGARIVVLARKLAEVTQRAEKAEAAVRRLEARLAESDVEQETGMTDERSDDSREKRWTITICRTCGEYWPYSGMCSCWYRDAGPEPVDVEVVPLERAEKAEAAARDFAEALATLRSAKTLRGAGAYVTPVVKQAGSDALARHPEYDDGWLGEDDDG